MKQRLGLAKCAILADSDILILDEPINGLDPEESVEQESFSKTCETRKNSTIN